MTHVFLAGLFAFASIHYAFQWWFSRHEHAFLVFAIQCAIYTAFCWFMVSVIRATTISASQRALDGTVTVGLLAHGVLLHFYAVLGRRRDRAFRILVSALVVLFVVANQVVPLRGTVVELHFVTVPGGGTAPIPIRTPPGLPLVLGYLVTAVAAGYGLFVARGMWRSDRAAATLLMIAVVSTTVGIVVGVLIDFVKLRVPYLGVLPHVIHGVCMSLLLAREYAARALRIAAAKQHFETAFEHAPTGMLVLDPTGIVLRSNRAACQILGSTAEALRVRHLRDLTDDDAEASALLAGSIASYTRETAIRRASGDVGWALVSVAIVPDHHGSPASIIAQIQDVTELRASRTRLEELVDTRTRELRVAKDEAERANAAKGEFLAHMSHEIRSPLGIVMTYAQLLQRDRTLGEPSRKKVDIMLSSSKHLLTLLNNVLEMSKIEAGRLELVDDEVDLWAVLDEVNEMFAIAVTAKGITLTTERSPDLPHVVRGDGGKAKQVLINLVSNAVKFTRSGSIHISASTRALSAESVVVELAVADTGPGIAASDIERMFEPFKQLESGARAGGTGLGLAISLAYARLMSGGLTASSKEGSGSTFTFWFPTKPVASRPAAEPRQASSSALVMRDAQCKVLIVDDLANNRESLQELFAQPTFETRTAETGHRALAIHAEWNPDVVLMDLRMPEMSGLEAIRRIRAAGSKVAIGVLSASAMADDEREALSVGADFFMRKPFDNRDLVEQITRLVGTRAAPLEST